MQAYVNGSGHTCWYWGVKANGDTLLNGHYGPILTVLRNPVANSHQQCVDLARAVGRTPWGTGDYERDC